ncbi:MAG TPA: HAD family hydrolase [Polyangiaceae bacterium]|nr:HAD family hydrolase [Polyangiaceae bacterium]
MTLAPTYTTEILPVAACYFDVDGTLVGTNLVHPTLYYLANQGTPLQSAVRLGRALLGAPRMALAELVDRRTFNELLFATYAGMSEDRLELLGEEAYRKVLLPSLYPSAKGLVAQSLAAGHDVVLVSGALECVIRHLARDLGATEVIANRLELKDGIATGKLLHPVVAGPEKARIVRDHARARGYDLDECYAFSDSYSDVPMLSVVGHPAVVNPDRRLSLLARAYSWPSFDLTRPT